VTIAYVAEMSANKRAERIGWFSSARNAGYVIGPAAAGGMLLFMDPVAIFTVIGVVSALAFLPVLLLPETARASRGPRPPLLVQARQAFTSAGRTPAVWLTGGLDAQFLVAKYAVKTFLPLQALSLGVSPAIVGAVLAAQETASMALSPLGGRIGDRVGYLKAVSAGMLGMAAALALMALAADGPAMLAPALLMGVAQALVFPSTIALVSAKADEAHLGAGMGMIGTFKNAAKVVGPIAAGLLVHSFGFGAALLAMAGIVALASAAVWVRSGTRLRRRSRSRPLQATSG
jgi:MFS family permease